MKKRSEIAKQLGRAGGLKTKEKYGTDHYRKMNEKRWGERKNANSEKTDI